jgi:exodeoxyribonuclease V alpha subunit
MWFKTKGVSLMAKLISAVPVNKKIIFLGDKNQLTSVEAGSVFGDICQTQSSSNLFSQSKLDFLNQFSEFDITKHLIQKPNFLSDHLVELQKSYRFDKNKGIGLISHAALSGHLDKLKIESFVNDNQVQIFTDYQISDFESFFQLYEAYITEKDTLKALKLFSETRLLTPIHEGDFSVTYFNQQIENYLKTKIHLSPQNSFYHNQPIMITQNDYHLKLFNGDIGLIRKDEKGDLQAYFEAEDGTLKQLNPNYINQYRTVFAMTIHKSQGSEFKNVALVLPQYDDSLILSKELLYTGLTRAKENLWIFSKAEILEKTSQIPAQRASGITERILKKENR